MAQQWIAEIPEDSQGFAEFNPDGRQVFIAPDGNDANPGTEQLPIASYKRAEKLIDDHDGGAVLFKRGGTFTINDNIQTSGKDAHNVLLIGAYGDTNLPRPVITNQLSLGGRDPFYQFIVIQSLDFQKSDNDGIRGYYNGSYLWIEDCRVQLAKSDGILLESAGNLSTIVMRRNQIMDCVRQDKCQGLYAGGVHDLIIDGNFADHNGWLVPSDRSIFSHDFYLQYDCGPVIFTNNFCSNAASHGAQQRPGGVNAGNYYFRNALALMVAKTPSVIEGNVIEGGSAINPALPRGQGLEIDGCDADVFGNLFVNKMDPVNNMSAVDVNLKSEDVEHPNIRVHLHDNIVFHWLNVGLVINKPVANLTQENNDWNGTGSYVDPNRSLESYAKSIGLKDADAFIAAARDNCRGGKYDPRVTAAAAVKSVRAGFAIK